MIDHAKLEADIRDAVAAAAAAIAAKPDDGGTCNLDTTLLCVGSDSTIRRFSSRTDNAVARGCNARSVSRFDHGWRGKGYLIFTGGGQGLSRTLGAETARRILNERGWTATVNYHTD